MNRTANAGVAAVLESVVYGSFRQRRAYFAIIGAINDPVKRTEFERNWQDQRSSMNNIGMRAAEIAKALRRIG